MKKKIEEIIVTLLVIALFIMTFIVTIKQFTISSCDYSVHLSEALNQGVFPNSLKSAVEYLWHACVMVVYRIIPAITPEYAATIVSSAVNSFTYIIVFCYMIKNNNCRLLAAFFTFCLFFIGPLYLPWFNENYYLGQSLSNTWHNPTNLMVKPFAVLTFILIVDILRGYKDHIINYRKLVILAVINSISCFAKPSWNQIFLPSMLIYLLIVMIQSRTIETLKFCFIIGAALLPAGLIMLLQFFTTFGQSADGGEPARIIIAPFVVIRNYTSSPLISFIISYTFPIIVFLCNKRIAKDTDTKFAFILWVIGSAERSLLAESGERMYHGNLGWGAALATLLIHLVAFNKFEEYVENSDMNSRADRWKLRIQLGFLLIGVWFGLRYWYRLATIEGLWL